MALQKHSEGQSSKKLGKAALGKENDYLSEICEKHDLSIPQLAKLIGSSPSSLYSVQKKQRNLSQTEKLALLYLFNSNPRDLGVDISLVKKFNVSNDSPKLVAYTNQYLKENKSYSGFIEDYYDTIINKVNNAKKSVLILTNHTKNFQNYSSIKFVSGAKAYRDFHRKYIQFIASINDLLLRNQNLKYDLYYQFPVDIPKSKKSKNNYMRLISESALQHLYSTDFAHISFVQQLERDNCKIRVFEKPIRSFGLIIIDGYEILSLYHFNSLFDESFPDILFSEVADNPLINDLIESHIDTIKRFEGKAIDLFSNSGGFEKIVKEIYEEEKDREDQLREEFDVSMISSPETREANEIKLNKVSQLVENIGNILSAIEKNSIEEVDEYLRSTNLI